MKSHEKKLPFIKYMPDIKWNSDIQSMANDAGENVSFILSLEKLSNPFSKALSIQESD